MTEQHKASYARIAIQNECHLHSRQFNCNQELYAPNKKAQTPFHMSNREWQHSNTFQLKQIMNVCFSITTARAIDAWYRTTTPSPKADISSTFRLSPSHNDSDSVPSTPQVHCNRNSIPQPHCVSYFSCACHCALSDRRLCLSRRVS